MGDLDVARQRIDAILRERPYNAAAYDLLLELLQRIGDMEAAKKVAARAAEQIPSATRSRRLGEIAYMVDDLDSAEAALTRVLKQTSKAITRDFSDRALLSQVCLARGEAQRAMKIVEQGAEDRLNDARVQALVAAVDVQGYTQLGWTAQASDSAVALERLIDTPADPRSRLLIAKGALTAGLTDAGLRVLGEAVQAAERISPATSASARALAAKVLVDAGLPERAVGFTADRAEAAMRQAEAAVKTMRSGGFDQAVEMIGEAMPLASDHTGVLSAAVEVYLMTMRVKGVRSDLLEQVRSVLVRLRARGTADPARLSMMDAYLQKLETGFAVADAVQA
jgi:tetratricopeptide (TPR) repeat protein